MTTAQLVNRITDKLSTGRVVFDHILSDGSLVISYGHHQYEIDSLDDVIRVRLSRGYAFSHGSEDSYTRWIEGVLNGKVRDDQGELLDELTAIAQKNGEYDV